MSVISRGFFWSAICFAFFSMPAQAQVDLPVPLPNGLIDWVNFPMGSSTDLQKSAAVGIETICVSMVENDLNNPSNLISGAARQLNNRCNELVSTANFMLDGGSIGLLVPWNANLTADELNASLQGIAGEELHSQATMSARVTNGQFANIAARMNALRLGNASAAIGGRVAYADPVDGNQSSPSLARVSFATSQFGSSWNS